MSTYIDTAALRPGLWGHWRGYAWIDRRIQSVCDSWGNHDSLFDAVPGFGWCSLDCRFPVNRPTPCDEDDERLSNGDLELRVYEVADATIAQEEGAAAWWMGNVNGELYDLLAFPRLWIKNRIGNASRSRCPVLRWIGNIAAGVENLEYCTEANARAYAHVGCRPLGRAHNLTPRDPELWVGDTLRDVTHEIVKRRVQISLGSLRTFPSAPRQRRA